MSRHPLLGIQVLAVMMQMVVCLPLHSATGLYFVLCPDFLVNYIPSLGCVKPHVASASFPAHVRVWVHDSGSTASVDSYRHRNLFYCRAPASLLVSTQIMTL